MDARANFAITSVTVAPTPAVSGTTLTVKSGGVFPAPPFNATVCPSLQALSAAQEPVQGSNAEIVRVTAVKGNELTIVRQEENTTARVIQVGDQIFQGDTERTFGEYAGLTGANTFSGSNTFHNPATTRGRITAPDPMKARSRNALVPQTVPSVDGTGQNVEPCVLYLPEGYADASGNVWTHLMVCAGYAKTNAKLENPSIRVCNDGKSWQAVTGAPDPLVPNPGGGVNNFDQSITIGPEGTLYVLYMTTDGATFDKTWVISTVDLVHWTAPQLLRTNSNIGAEREQAPVAQWDGTQWHVWTVQFVPATPSGIMHYTGASITAALAGTGTLCTIVNQPETPTVLWEHNIIRVGELWCGVITAKTGTLTVLYFMTSSDGKTWTMGTQPLLRPQAQSQGSLWDRGQIYRSTLAVIDSGHGGLRFSLWYGGADQQAGEANWGIGHTEAWFADVEAPRGAITVPAVPSKWYLNPVVNTLNSGALTLNDLYVYIAYSGEFGLMLNQMACNVAAGVASSELRGGIYIANDQMNPFSWAAETVWGTLVSELAGALSGASTGVKNARFAGTQNLWVPPRTWFGVAGACQGAAINVYQGKITCGNSPYGSSAGYNNTPYCCLFATGVSGVLPSLFTPVGGGQVDNGLAFETDSTQPV